ncbi:hypothetical protein F5I97DRAFT_1835619 [Phlebopus sp. FC_14]|nr:hypothetical protein F5I97DRAFT_1835619 [Phlebopus sp. FC_14]
MQLMLAYRLLRKISDWSMFGFYSEVSCQWGQERQRDGPLFRNATHHNEIINIAALSVTIPYRRQVHYWAKFTLFKNPVSGALLTSAGSIPVNRNRNNGGTRNTSSSSATQAALFRHASAALARGEVVGVFPEGTSYTAPAVAQVKDGATWAAVEYAKAENARDLDSSSEDDNHTRRYCVHRQVAVPNPSRSCALSGKGRNLMYI